jgi:GrpB-like predicted nucleotidyltransferase (UPF0157 family)
MSQEPIRIVEYDPEWPNRYETAAARIREAGGDRFVALEHIGSTAVPGLAAKPIVDVLGGVERLADGEAAVEALEALGYEYVPELEAAIPERRYFYKTDDDCHTHHLHVVEHGGPFWTRHLQFRDYLREHPDRARRYEKVKREAACDHRHDIEGYEDAKAAFVRETETLAAEYYGRD